MIRMSVEEYQETQDRLKGLPASQPTIIGNRVEKKKASKHRNVRVRIDNINFASKVEGRRYQQLKFLEDQGAWYTPFTRPGMTGPYKIRQ
ncbi:MAG: hypothetical protein B7Z02_07110 [Rhodobacterales bacterium 32-67-9]|nr:MAG: hypothetical protein B7Z02_07110 [Rhodobacterales bacterium 32-67-9]